jgi:hypothetical protein
MPQDFKFSHDVVVNVVLNGLAHDDLKSLHAAFLLLAGWVAGWVYAVG